MDDFQYSAPVLTAFRPEVSAVKSPPRAAVWFAAIGIVVLGGDGLYAGIASARPHIRDVVVAGLRAELSPQQIAGAAPVVVMARNPDSSVLSGAVITAASAAVVDQPAAAAPVTRRRRAPTGEAPAPAAPAPIEVASVDMGIPTQGETAGYPVAAASPADGPAYAETDR
jgi:hypothetical protein